MNALKLGMKKTTKLTVDKVDLNKMYELIGCDTVEFVDMPFIKEYTGIPAMMVIDEEGKLKDKWMGNPAATALYWMCYKRFDPIAGIAIILKDTGEDLVPFTDEEMDKINWLLNRNAVKHNIRVAKTHLALRGLW